MNKTLNIKFSLDNMLNNKDLSEEFKNELMNLVGKSFRNEFGTKIGEVKKIWVENNIIMAEGEVLLEEFEKLHVTVIN